MRRGSIAFAIALATLAGSAAAATPNAGVFEAGAPGGPPFDDAGAVAPKAERVSGCVETIPKGATRPDVIDSFPPVGTSGFAATLAIRVKHGKGEKVLPGGLDLGSAIEVRKLLKEAGFGVPDQQGTGAARLYTEEEDTTATTHFDLSVVLLPTKPGRQTLLLPALPVAVQRANGELVTVCTKAHTVYVEDPLANVPEAKPKPNPEARPQREEWTSLKKALEYGGLGLLGGALLAYFAWKVATKPKPLPPPPPPRPPWDVALEKLDHVRHAGLLDADRHGEYFDRVSDAVRGYLGARFGFDGLESTTDEALAALLKHGGGFLRFDSAPLVGGITTGIPLEEIAAFLRECDLVKFANLTPNPEQCTQALVAGVRIVRATMPAVTQPSTQRESRLE